ncbi:MAG: L-seryl-tRNA(Sec) selenium transferase [Gemmatimonadaceae bacterium]|nr:L-seryl-tRNA(Sec) selenium transferase [Gemmatimonadaceae bacterium]
MITDPRRTLPAVSLLLERPGVRALAEAHSHAFVVDVTRALLDRARRDATVIPASIDGWEEVIRTEVTQRARRSLRRVLNGTGVVLHTNLGRAPLAASALDALVDTARGASSLEYDVDRGARGSRYVHAVPLLCELTGAEDALVVNNGAGALVLALTALASGREVIVSRGELVEIGGSFRVPDIMAAGGAKLVEVGTTNRTHLPDYARAISERTGAIVRVHRSNFAIEGFTAAPSAEEIGALARTHGVPFVHDLGSGLLTDLSAWGLSGEPTARDAVREGADLVLMSGDKLLGGPQAGLIVGRRVLVERLRTHPLTRALRVDKLTLAALEATLLAYRDPTRARAELPALAMLTVDAAALRTRAEAICVELSRVGVAATVAPSEASVGGGAFPTAVLPSFAVVLLGNAERHEARLRATALPVIGRIHDGALRIDLRGILPSDDGALIAALAALGVSP